MSQQCCGAVCVKCPVVVATGAPLTGSLTAGQMQFDANSGFYYYQYGGQTLVVNPAYGAGLQYNVATQSVSVGIDTTAGLAFTAGGQISINCTQLISHCGLVTQANLTGVANSIPAQVNLIAGTGISVSGTYPNLTVASTASGGTSGLTSVAVSAPFTGNGTVGSPLGIDCAALKTGCGLLGLPPSGTAAGAVATSDGNGGVSWLVPAEQSANLGLSLVGVYDSYTNTLTSLLSAGSYKVQAFPSATAVSITNVITQSYVETFIQTVGTPLCTINNSAGQPIALARFISSDPGGN